VNQGPADSIVRNESGDGAGSAYIAEWGTGAYKPKGDAVKRCKSRDCPLISQEPEVPYDGPTNADLLIVGESPGWKEEQRGKPFRGDSGQLLKQVASSTVPPLPIGKSMLCNSSRCRIKKDARNKSDIIPGAKEVTLILKECRPKLERIIHAVKPKVILLLGDIACRQIRRKSGIKNQRGQ
jgi:uracil-DNA glycosylase family 4